MPSASNQPRELAVIGVSSQGTPHFEATQTTTSAPPSRLTWRLLPGIAVFGVAVAVLVSNTGGVDLVDVALFTAYFALCVVLPGVLVWRALGVKLTHRIEEYAVGACVGYVIEALARIAASAAGFPEATVAVPVIIVVASLLWRPWRTHWRSKVTPTPVSIGWAYAAICIVLLIWLGYTYYRLQPVAWSGTASPYADLVHTLAYATDVAHRWPPEFPYVHGEPLYYHWFFGAHLAQANTVTGIDFPTLLFRLYLVPMVLVLVVATGTLGTRMARRAWAGPLAGGIAYLAQELNLMPLDESVETTGSATGSLLGDILWWSPSVPFAAATLLPAMLLAIDLVRRRGIGAGGWVVLALCVLISAGAKSTALPVLIVALGFVVLLTLLIRRRWHWPAAAACALASAVFVVAIFAIYGGKSYGMKPDLFGFADVAGVSTFLGLDTAELGFLAGGLIMIMMLVAHIVPWCGAFLLAGRATRSDPAVWLAAGSGVCGLAALIGLYHIGQSQLYFLRSAFPLLAAAAAWGIVAKVPRGWHPAVLFGGIVALGAGASALIQQYDGVHPGQSMQWLERYATMMRPYAILAGVVLVIALGYVLLRPRLSASWRSVGVGAVAVGLLLGAAMLRLPTQAGYVVYQKATGGKLPEWAPAGPGFSGDSLSATQWLRDNSDVDDVVMTNVHCRNGPYEHQPDWYCDNLAFWAAAYSERRFLVHGWGYTPSNAEKEDELADGDYVSTIPFWDEQLLRRNEEFLDNPTPGEAEALKHEYGVRWIFVDREFGEVSLRLEDVARLRYEKGRSQVYELR